MLASRGGLNGVPQPHRPYPNLLAAGAAVDAAARPG